MKELAYQFLEGRTSRRGFIQALTALGVSTAGVSRTVRALEAVSPEETAAASAAARDFTGTGGELMVEQMKAAGVKYLFTNPGSFEVGFFDAFLDQPMQLIMGLHEGIVISMADGYHKASGEPAFVNVHVIAGTAQSAGQLYNSSRDGSALVVTAGLLDNERTDDELMLAPRPGFDQKDVNRQFTKISWETRDPAAIPVMLRRAFKVATTPPGGPVYLALADHALEAKGVSGAIYDRESFLIPDEIPPRPEDIERIATLLLEARSPVIHVGDEVSRNGAQAEVLALAEVLKVPVRDTNGPAHSFPRKHPLYAGRYSSNGHDLILRIGVSDTGGTNPGAPDAEGAKVAWVGLNTANIGNDRPFDVAAIANPKLAAAALCESIEAMATRDRLERIRAARPDSKPAYREVDRTRVGLSPIHPDELGWALEQELDANAIVVSENLSGSNQFLGTGFRENEKTWMSTAGVGLGWGIGASIGAKLGQPGRQVVCNIGDGSVMYSASGFWTQARYGVPVLTVVCNNRNYQTVRQAYARYDGKMKKANRYTGMHLGDPNIDFVQLAASQGVEGARVESSADLIPALRRGMAATHAGQPYLLEVVVDRRGDGGDSTWHQEFKLADQTSGSS
jgi:benzoylformate decarboxylase